MNTMSRETITVAEAAKRLGVSVGTVYSLAHRGELEGYRVGRRILIYANAIEAYQKRHAVSKAEPPPEQPARPAQPTRRQRTRDPQAGVPPGFYRDPLTGEIKPFRHVH